MPHLTIGMASYNNFQQVWFTVQALRMYQDLTDTEILIIDNYGDDTLRDFCAANGGGQVRYVRYTDVQGTSAPRNKVFEEALGEWVMCIDSHVMLDPGTVKRFRGWAEAHDQCMDLLQGPILFDDMKTVADAWDDVWDSEMWGLWRISNYKKEFEHYDIPMMGLGLFACRKDAWLGFNPEFRGFGGEEGYIHQKYRNAGRRVLSLPWLRWLHWFSRHGDNQQPVPYPLLRADKIRNYEIGFAEVGIDPTRMREHFGIAKPEITNIQIDPNGECGSKCWFCPVRYIDRPAHQVMSQDLFEKILDGISDGVNQGSVDPNYTLWLSSYNDILLDPNLPDRLEALRKRGMKFCCLTNGIGLQKNFKLLHEYRDVVTSYSVDLPAGDNVSYAKHTGAALKNFNQIIKGLKYLHELDPEYYARVVHIGVNGAYDEQWNRDQLLYDLPASDTDAQVEKLKSLLPMYPRIEAMRPLCDRAGHLAPYAIDNKVNRPDAKGCNRLTEWLHVNSLGRAYTCCQDFKEEHQFADLTQMSIHEALQLDRSAAVASTKEALCTRCTFSA